MKTLTLCYKIAKPTLDGNHVSIIYSALDWPDLKPQLMTIAGYPAWGTEGGDNPFITDALDENGMLEERLTSPAPSTLMVTKGDISYSFEAYLPLSELIEICKEPKQQPRRRLFTSTISSMK